VIKLPIKLASDTVEMNTVWCQLPVHSLQTATYDTARRPRAEHTQ